MFIGINNLIDIHPEIQITLPAFTIPAPQAQRVQAIERSAT
jgi:hypothetical protein